FLYRSAHPPDLPSFPPTRRSSDLPHALERRARPLSRCQGRRRARELAVLRGALRPPDRRGRRADSRCPSLARVSGLADQSNEARSEEHTSELQSRSDLVCRLLLEK